MAVTLTAIEATDLLDLVADAVAYRRLTGRPLPSARQQETLVRLVVAAGLPWDVQAGPGQHGTMDLDELVPLDDAAALAGVSTKTLRRRVRRGELEIAAVDDHGAYLVRVGDVI